MIQTVELDLPKEILTRIDSLAAKLGTTAELLWPELVRYEFGRGVGSVALAAVLATSAAVMVGITLRASTKVRMSGKVKVTKETGYPFAGGKEVREWEEDAIPLHRPHVIVLLAASVLISFTAIVCIFEASEAVPALMSPAGAAVRSILGR